MVRAERPVVIDGEPSGTELRAVYRQCLGRLPAEDEDHPLDTDIAAAEQVIAAWT